MDRVIHYYSSVEPTEVTVSLSLVLCVLSHFSHVQLFVTLWTVANQDLLLMEFSRQEYWSGLPPPSLGDLCMALESSISEFESQQVI